jgi:hypothetical protein
VLKLGRNRARTPIRPSTDINATVRAVRETPDQDDIIQSPGSNAIFGSHHAGTSLAKSLREVEQELQLLKEGNIVLQTEVNFAKETLHKAEQELQLLKESNTMLKTEVKLTNDARVSFRHLKKENEEHKAGLIKNKLIHTTELSRLKRDLSDARTLHELELTEQKASHERTIADMKTLHDLELSSKAKSLEGQIADLKDLVERNLTDATKSSAQLHELTGHMFLNRGKYSQFPPSYDFRDVVGQWKLLGREAKAMLPSKGAFPAQRLLSQRLDELAPGFEHAVRRICALPPPVHGQEQPSLDDCFKNAPTIPPNNDIVMAIFSAVLLDWVFGTSYHTDGEDSANTEQLLSAVAQFGELAIYCLRSH